MRWHMWLGMVALLSQRLTGGNHPCCHGNVNTRLCRHLHCCYCASVDNACTGVVNACTGVDNACTGVDNACTGVVNTCTFACVVRKIWYDYLYYTRALFRLCEQFKHVKRLDLLLNTLTLTLSLSLSLSLSPQDAVGCGTSWCVGPVPDWRKWSPSHVPNTSPTSPANPASVRPFGVFKENSHSKFKFEFGCIHWKANYFRRVILCQFLRSLAEKYVRC